MATLTARAYLHLDIAKPPRKPSATEFAFCGLLHVFRGTTPRADAAAPGLRNVSTRNFQGLFGGRSRIIKPSDSPRRDEPHQTSCCAGACAWVPEMTLRPAGH